MDNKQQHIKELTDGVISLIKLCGSLFIVFLLTVVLSGLGFFKALAGFILFHYFLSKISNAFHPVFNKVTFEELRSIMELKVTKFVNWIESK